MSELLNTRQTAKVLGVCESTLFKWRTQNIGPPFMKVGSIVKYRKMDIEKWVEQQVKKTED